MDRKAFLSQNAGGESTSAAFRLLDSPDIQAVQDFVENLKNFEKEPWVVENLITYYLSSQSSKAADLIVKCRSEHDRIIFKRLHSAFEDTATRKQTLKLLLYIVSKKPPWLHKIVKEQILMDIFRCLKYEKNVPLLMDAVYIITMILPIVPDGMVKHFDDIFDSLLRLTQLAYYNKEGEPEAYILHLNVGLYSLFARLYGMYPWHYLCSLQDQYSKNKIPPEFYKSAIEPMLSTVKLNPGLVTSSKDSESRGDQWRKKDTHDIVAECASLSLDVTETTKDYISRCPVLITRDHEGAVRSAMHLPQDEATNNPSESKMAEELSAPIELAKDSLVSVAANSSTFFSPSDRLGLSTPPPVDLLTPSALTAGQSHFNFSTPNRGTPQQSAPQIKTPHNTNHNTPNHYTPKNTPTTPMNGSESTASRSRHTSGTKGSLSRLSIEEPIPPSPLRKEFTSEPPSDVPRIISMCSETSTVNTTTLSVSNLPHLLEKISDTGSVHGTDDNDSEDEEVESINTLTDQLTTKSVAEFMKTVNRIRFISMTNAETDGEKSTGKGVRRSGSCPTFTEDMTEVHEDSKTPIERSSSIQTKSSNDMRLSEGTPNNEATPEPGAPCDIRSTDTGHRIAGIELLGVRSAYDNPLPSSTTGLFQSISENVPGAGSALDKHIMLLHQELRLGTVVQSQLQQSTLPQTGAVNWTHFGGSPPADEVSIARGQLLLLHTQLMYERQKRELHAERNRRLLRQIAKSEKLKENNLTLQKNVDRLNDDIFNLQTTIRLQNNEIHRLRDEKSRNDAIRERDQASLIKENEDLKYANEELHRAFDAKKENLEIKSKALAESIGKVERLEQDLHMTCVERAKYSRFEDEVGRMKKELLLMGEVQVKYEEKLAALKYDNQMTLMLPEQEAIYLKDIYKLKDSLQKQTDHCQFKQNQVEALSAKSKEQDRVISEHVKQTELVRGEHKCRIQAMEDKYQMSESARQTLEIQLLGLHEQVGRLSVTSGRRPIEPHQTNGS